MKESGMDIKQEVNYHNNKKIGRWEKSRGVRERIEYEERGYQMSGAAARTGGLKEIGEKERYMERTIEQGRKTNHVKGNRAKNKNLQRLRIVK